MNKRIIFTLFMAISAFSHAGLVDLDNDALTQVTGQGGADLSWTLSLNHKYANDMSLSSISKMDANGKVTEAYYSTQCVSDILCRVAVAFNNQKVSDLDKNGNAQQKWLVLKKFQGTLQVDKFQLDGTTILNKDGNQQSAMKLTFLDDKPLKIRNLGFTSASIEVGAAGAEQGYANNKVYGQGGYATNAATFDTGTEKGFMGMNVHGNLQMSGNLKVFSYNCTGAAGSRC